MVSLLYSALYELLHLIYIRQVESGKITVPILQTGEVRFREVIGNLLGATTLVVEEHGMTKNCQLLNAASLEGLYPMGTAKREERLRGRKDDGQIPKLWSFVKEILFGFPLLSKISILLRK